MADIFDPKKRSEVMASVRGKNTKPELTAYRYLRKENVYFQKHYRCKEGIVLDIALPRKKRAVFIDGDFWHGRGLDKLSRKNGEDNFWVMKLRDNVERDSRQRKLLENHGWSLLSVWTSDLMKKSTQPQVLTKIKSFLES